MLTTEIHEAAVEFGRALRQVPAIAAYRQAIEAFEADHDAQGLLDDLREHQATLARTQQAGLTPSQEQIDRFRLCRAAVRANEAIMANLRATNDVKAFLPTAALEVSRTLGADYGSLVAPTSC